MKKLVFNCYTRTHLKRNVVSVESSNLERRWNALVFPVIFEGPRVSKQRWLWLDFGLAKHRRSQNFVFPKITQVWLLTQSFCLSLWRYCFITEHRKFLRKFSKMNMQRITEERIYCRANSTRDVGQSVSFFVYRKPTLVTKKIEEVTDKFNKRLRCRHSVSTRKIPWYN